MQNTETGNNALKSCIAQEQEISRLRIVQWTKYPSSLLMTRAHEHKQRSLTQRKARTIDIDSRSFYQRSLKWNYEGRELLKIVSSYLVNRNRTEKSSGSEHRNVGGFIDIPPTPGSEQEKLEFLEANALVTYFREVKAWPLELKLIVHSTQNGCHVTT